METAEDWAKRWGVPVMSEEQYVELQRWASQAGPYKHVGSTSLPGKSVSEIEEFLAEQNSMGKGMIPIGVLPPYTGPDDLVPMDPPSRERLEWDNRILREARQHVRLVIGPDPHPQLADPATVTFTPEILIAQVKERAVSRPVFGSGARLLGPITQIQAALMTVPEVGPLLDHGISPGRPGTVPGVLVCLVLIRGVFGPGMFFGPRPPGSRTPRECWMYEVHNTRDGHAFWTGGGRAHWDIKLEYGVSWTA